MVEQSGLRVSSPILHISSEGMLGHYLQLGNGGSFCIE